MPLLPKIGLGGFGGIDMDMEGLGVSILVGLGVLLGLLVTGAFVGIPGVTVGGFVGLAVVGSIVGRAVGAGVVGSVGVGAGVGLAVSPSQLRSEAGTKFSCAFQIRMPKT